jgi:hypothetical protein
MMSPGKIIGYIRVSSFGQNPERQLEGLRLDKIFTDKISGKDTQDRRYGQYFPGTGERAFSDTLENGIYAAT